MLKFLFKTALLIALVPLALAYGLQACTAALPDLEIPGAGTQKAHAKPRGVRVGRAVDGDTLLVRVGGRESYVRLIGIDTSESVRPATPLECGAEQATDSMHALAPEGAKVRLVADPSQERVDRYGRLLRYAETRGRDIAETHLRRGLAEPYAYDEHPFARLGSYRRAASEAQAEGAGIWGSCGGDFHSGSRRRGRRRSKRTRGRSMMRTPAIDKQAPRLGLGADIDEEVQIGVTDPAPRLTPAEVARRELVSWCLANGMPVPPARERRWR